MKIILMLYAIPITLSLLSYRRFEWRWLVGASWKQLELVGSGRIQLEPCLLISHALVTVTSWRELLLASGISDHGRPWKEGFFLEGPGSHLLPLSQGPKKSDGGREVWADNPRDPSTILGRVGHHSHQAACFSHWGLQDTDLLWVMRWDGETQCWRGRTG